MAVRQPTASDIKGIETRGKRQIEADSPTPLILIEEPLNVDGQVEGVGVGEGMESIRVQVLHDLLIGRGELKAGVPEDWVKVFSKARVALRRNHHHGVPVVWRKGPQTLSIGLVTLMLASLWCLLWQGNFLKSSGE